MIRELRQRHLKIATLLSILGPVVLALALAARPSKSPPHGLPLPSTRERGAVGRVQIAIRGLPLELAAAVDPASATFDLIVRSPVSLRAPDPLLYWTTTAPSDERSLPRDALLIGSVGLSASRHRVPFPDLSGSGVLVLWSQGHRRVLGTTPFELAALIGGAAR